MGSIEKPLDDCIIVHASTIGQLANGGEALDLAGPEALTPIFALAVAMPDSSQTLPIDADFKVTEQAIMKVVDPSMNRKFLTSLPCSNHRR